MEDSQGNESSDDGLDVEIYNEDMTMHIAEDESDRSSDDFMAPSVEVTIDSESENSEGDDGHSEHLEGSSSRAKWEEVTDKDKSPFSFEFKTPRATGPQISKELRRPIDYFKLYFTDALMDGIVETTNEYAQMKIHKKKLANQSIWHSWVDVTREEFLAFTGVVLNMGTMPLANISEYWTTRRNSRIPFYPQVFRRDRFRQIFWMLHLQGSASCNKRVKSRIGKVNSFLQYIDSKFREYFIPGRDICIHESIVRFKGKIVFVTHNPRKQTKRGTRIYLLADADTGYVYSILPYYGSLMANEDLENPGFPIKSRIPLTLIKKLLNNIPNAEGYHLYTDKSFTSIPLANELLKVKVHLTGTVRQDHKYLPGGIKKPKFSTKSTVAYRQGGTLVLAWKKKQIETFISTNDVASVELIKTKVLSRDGTTVNLLKPIVAIHYDKNTKAIDRANQYSATFCFLRKSLKWWRKLFFWGLEMCVINAYIMHRLISQQKDEKPLSHLSFVKCLVDELVGEFQRQAPRKKIPVVRTRPSSTSADLRLNNQLHVLRLGNKKDCVVCSDRKSGKRKETRMFCDTCTSKPRLHIGDCFVKYHTLDSYRDQ